MRRHHGKTAVIGIEQRGAGDRVDQPPQTAAAQPLP
jgi:hypothetical protein